MGKQSFLSYGLSCESTSFLMLAWVIMEVFVVFFVYFFCRPVVIIVVRSPEQMSFGTTVF